MGENTTENDMFKLNIYNGLGFGISFKQQLWQ